jgi:hypothetical protein
MERERRRARSGTNLMPAAVGPRLQTGDLLRISGSDFVVSALRKNKAVVKAFCSPGTRDFTVTFEYALAMRKRAPRRLPHTVTLLNQLRSGSAPITVAAIAAAAGEKHLDAVDRHGQTALILAAARGDSMALLTLLRYDADVLAHDPQGETALHKACAHGHVDCVVKLLAHGADASVDALSACGGQSALHLAAANGHTCVARRLLEAGASVERCARGAVAQLDAMLLALLHGHLETAAALAGYSSVGITWAYARWHHRCKLDAHAHVAATQWLHDHAHFCTPLHCLERMSPARACELLRSGSDIHATSDAEYCAHLPAIPAPVGHVPTAPSPLSIARALISANACDDALPKGSRAADEGGGVAAAKLVVLASLPWRPSNHHTFPQPQRARAFASLMAAHRVAKAYGGSASHALVEVWLDVIIPMVVVRPSAGGASTLAEVYSGDHVHVS